MSKNLSTYPPVVVKLVLCLIILTFSSCNESENKLPQVTTNAAKVATPEKVAETNVILCFGNSLTEGYGLQSEEAFPSKIQNKIDICLR